MQTGSRASQRAPLRSAQRSGRLGREARALIGDRAGIIAKIEKPSALTEIEAIVEAADAVMVARGDLGVELPPEQVPIAQRKIIRAHRIFAESFALERLVPNLVELHQKTLVAKGYVGDLRIIDVQVVGNRVYASDRGKPP